MNYSDSMDQPTAAGSLRRRTTLLHTLEVLRRRWWILVAVIFVAVGVSLARSLSERSSYSATAALLFQNTNLDQAFFGSSALPPSTDAQQEANTNTALTGLDAIAAAAVTALHREGVHANALDVHNAVAIQQAGESNVVDVVATMPSARQAAEVANAYAQAFVTFRRKSDQAKVQQAIQLVQQQVAQLPARSPKTVQLAHDVSQLEVLKALQTGNAEVVQTATPPLGPSGPRTKRSAAIAAVLGALLGTLLILFVERLDRRLRSVGDVQELFEKPVLAAIPDDRELASRATPKTGNLLEPFRILRANLAYFRIGRERRSLIVASGSPGEGKTTVALNLAVAAVLAGQRVILLEADLRRPSLTQRLGVTGAHHGLSEVLSGQVSREEAVVAIPLSEVFGAKPDAHLDVMFAGTTPPNPAELVESDHMAELLGALETQYDLVVIDTPPVTVVSDALQLLSRGPGVVVVVRLNQTTRDSATRLRDQLVTIGVAPLGIVVNAVPSRGEKYYHYGESTNDSSNGSALRSRDRNGQPSEVVSRS